MITASRLLFAALASLAIGNAGAHSLSLLGSEYSTDLRTILNQRDPSTGATTVTTATQTATSDAPLAKELVAHELTFAKAQASPYSVSTQTSAFGSDLPGGGNASARAQTVLSFKALQHTEAALTIDIEGSGFSFFSDGFVSLYDVTTSAYVFSYAWNFLSIPPAPPPPGSLPLPWESVGNATLALNQRLDASHVYDLTLHASTTGSGDSQFVSVRLSGLDRLMAPVPEPSLAALMFAGLGVVGGIAALRRKRQTDMRLQFVG